MISVNILFILDSGRCSGSSEADRDKDEVIEDLKGKIDCEFYSVEKTKNVISIVFGGFKLPIKFKNLILNQLPT